MAETLLSFGVQKLWDLLVRESERFKRVDEKLNELKDDLMWLKSFLKDADAKKHEKEMVKTCVGQIDEIVLDAEDIIETFILKDERRNGIMKHMRRFSCITVDRIKVASDIESIRKRISKVIQRMQELGVQQITIQGGESSHPLRESLEDIRQTFPSNSECNLVGLEENVEKLVGYLVKDDSSQITALTGMGGIGKTTLARQAYNDERVKKHFSGLVWVCLSKDFNRQNVWESIFEKLSSKHDEQRDSCKSDDDDGLHGKLFRLLETSNSLIVLDDIWKEDDWDKMKPVFPPNKGWKVILTSRNKNVALHADPTCNLIELDSLTSDESWTLFQRILFPRKDTTEYKNDIDEMEKLGKQMIKHCGGLPLAVKVLGGLLAARYTLSEWKRLYKNIGCRIIKTSSVYEILYLSFEELPSYLKHCFLYFAHFPEDYTIDVEMLSYLWAAEGILRPRPRHFHEWTTREVADECIAELVKRNMVISDKDELTSRFKICRLHDMMREVCLHKAEEEDFVRIIDREASTPTSQSPYKSRRLVIEYSYPIPVDMNGCSTNPKLRSFLCIHRSCKHKVRISFTRLQLMRVLDLSYALFKGKKLPSSIGELIHLRYLSLRYAEVTHLPPKMRNLKKLLYLNLHVHEASPMYVPDLSEMRELEYLALPPHIHDKVKMELGYLVNLVTLENFSTKNSSMEDLHQMTKLETLSIRYRDGCTMEILSSTIRELRQVENLSIIGEVFDRKNDKEFVLDCNDCNRTTQLYLCIYMPKLPQHFPSRLTTIHLYRCRLKEDPMPLLEKLNDLKEVFLSYYSFCGKKMICSDGGFRQLRWLKLWRLVEWEDWIVKRGSMPLLHTLTIDDCEKFKQLDALQFITSLKTLNLCIPARNKKKEWKEKLSEGGEDYYKVQHIPHVKIY